MRHLAHVGGFLWAGHCLTLYPVCRQERGVARADGQPDKKLRRSRFYIYFRRNKRSVIDRNEHTSLPTPQILM
jgi:hypothetical protein